MQGDTCKVRKGRIPGGFSLKDYGTGGERRCAVQKYLYIALRCLSGRAGRGGKAHSHSLVETLAWLVSGTS
jgi:hypothetical protein